MKILIVDDDRMLVHVLTARLRSAGFEVAVAFDGMQATMMLNREPPSAVLLDLGLPGGSGLEVLRRIRASARTTLLPVVVSSANSDPGLLAQVRELGVSAVLPKPVDFQQLQGVLAVMGDPGPVVAGPGSAARAVPPVLAMPARRAARSN